MQVNTYLENYERALSGFEAAGLKDPCLNATEEVEKMVNLFNKLDSLLKVSFYFSIVDMHPDTVDRKKFFI